MIEHNVHLKYIENYWENVESTQMINTNIVY